MNPSRLASLILLAASALFAACQHPAASTPPANAAAAQAPAAPAPVAAPAGEADKATRYIFGWGDLPEELAKPRGGSSRGAPVTLAPGRTLPLPAIAQAASAFERDRAAILALAGDYRVGFHFMESVGLTAGYQPVRPYHSWATEQVAVIADTGRFISLQHTLVMYFRKDDGSISAPQTMKHWRQDWTYEDTDLHAYRGDNTWSRLTLPREQAAGAWTQAVFQVDDSPRYESYGRWEHTGNVSAWTGASTLRPLPRREHTVRKDYSVMEGVHRIVITPTGWLHEQRNWKRVAGESTREPQYVAQELGLDRYELITAPSLAAASDDWKKTAPYWAAVRQVWTELYAQHDRFTLRSEVNGEPQFQSHFSYTEKLEDGQAYDSVDGERHARETISRFLESASAP